MLVFKSRIKLFFKGLFEKIISIDIDYLTGIFVFILLFMLGILWWKALVFGVVGYIIFCRLEKTLINYAQNRRNKI